MSPFTRLYYSIKPFVPWSVRMILRRRHAQRIRRKCSSSWPILESAGHRPNGWRGWPDGARFAFVLTHDVESAAGVAKVRQLAELEMSLGLRSSFNFIPEGTYPVPGRLLDWLVENGFEVGVHDLHHDGKLYRSRTGFLKQAARINSYLAEWKAVGFRSGFMLRNLDWLHDLDIAYDSSTFDTDPFEPQPDGVGTIFPFWVPRSSGPKSELETSSVFRPRPSVIGPQLSKDGYIELPYTLPQDFTLYFLLEERSNEIWFTKRDWIAERGGMVLLNMHPDYMVSTPNQGCVLFCEEFYREFLEDTVRRYGDNMWNVLPRQVAAYARQLQRPSDRCGDLGRSSTFVAPSMEQER